MPARYIFCANVGRSGSHYLSRLFDAADGCTSVHEPKPRLHGRVMQAFLAGDEAPMRAEMPAKVASIRHAAGSGSYFESNHCFIKGFGWLLPDYLPEEDIAVISLRRDPEAVVRSMRRVLCSPFLRSGDDWIITPRADHHVPLPAAYSFPRPRYELYRLLCRTVLRPRIVRTLTGGRATMVGPVARYQDDLIRWYIAETESRTRRFQARFPRATYVDVHLDELNDMSSVSDLLSQLGLAAGPSMEHVVGRATNKKQQFGPGDQASAAETP